DLFPPSLKLETDLVNLKEALAQGYRQLKQIQGQFTLLGAGGIKTARMDSDDNGSAGALQDPAGYTAFLNTLLERDVADRLVLDLRPAQDFAARHLQNATHLSGGWTELNSRFSTYLPPRGAPFLVLCLASDETDVRRNLGERDGLIGVIVCRSDGAGFPSGPSPTAEDALLDPLGASESSLWAAAERKGVLRSSVASTPGGSAAGTPQGSPFSSPGGSKRGAHTLASAQPGPSSSTSLFSRISDDTPHLMGQPSPALARMYKSHIRHAFLGRRTSARALDLGCGAGRDLAWLAYRGQMHKAHGLIQRESEAKGSAPGTEIAWKVTGLDNLRPVLHRAQHLMDAYGLMLHDEAAQNELSEEGTAGCEALLWGQVSPTGSLLALRTSGSSPDTGGRNGKPFLAVDPEQLGGALLPQGASAYALALPHGQNPQDSQHANTAATPPEPFDLIILVRFLPRTLLWDRPDTIHALVRRGNGERSASDPGDLRGGFFLLSHFVVPEEAEATTLTAGQPVRRIYDAPPEPARLQAGEVRRLVQSWNTWWTAQQVRAGDEVEDRPEWVIVEDVVEPIEDGRAAQSVLIQRR
ncbi:hypothetical protein CF336_g5735, partial [Tilletia laevis]